MSPWTRASRPQNSLRSSSPSRSTTKITSLCLAAISGVSAIAMCPPCWQTLLFSVAAVTCLFGGFAVILAIPFVAVLATIIDVIVFNKNRAEEGVPTVLFPAEDAEN